MGAGSMSTGLSAMGPLTGATTEGDFLSRPMMPGSCPSSRRSGRTARLYVLDWYDRYHCYQDANRDPNGIDRLKGRLYRVRHGGYPPGGEVRPRQGVGRPAHRPTGQPQYLSSGRRPRRLLRRAKSLGSVNASLRAKLDRLLEGRRGPPSKARLRCPLDVEHRQLTRAPARSRRDLMYHQDPTFRAWGVRAAGNVRVFCDPGGGYRKAVLDRDGRPGERPLARRPGPGGHREPQARRASTRCPS